MGIDVAWVNEGHEVKQIVGDPLQIITRLAINRWSKLNNSVCLRFVMPWDDAVFNAAQNRDLQSELNVEIGEASDPKVRAHLRKVLTLVELADKTHTYIKFIGD